MENNETSLYSVKGVDGQFELYTDRLEIHRKGVVTYVTRGLHRHNVYPIEQIRKIEVTNPTKLKSRGYAIVQRAGDYNLAPSRNRAAGDRDTILLANMSQANAVRELNDRILELKDRLGLGTDIAPIMQAEGFDGAVTLLRDRVVVSQKDKLLSKMAKGAVGAQEIRLRNITGVQLKKPGMTKGYIQFQASGHLNHQRGILGAMQDELSVAIANAKQYEKFLELKRRVDQMIDESHAPQQVEATQLSVADELGKLVSLKEQGILTEEEFDHQKSKLLAK